MSTDKPIPQPASRIVDPTVKFIFQILDELRSGQLFIPRFQRGDVWDDDDRIELLNSIETLIPIGSIMLWRTQISLETRRRIGGHILPKPPQQPPNTNRDYVLDGLQRLSTLLRALAPNDQDLAATEDLDEDDAPPQSIYYDLREQVFRVRGREVQEPWHLPTTVILHTVPLLAFQRQLSAQKFEDRDELVQRADILANSFRTYKIPAVWLVTNRLEDATQAFHRINSKGVTMSEVHMLNALTYGNGFDLEQKLDELKPLLTEVGWEKLDAKYLLATIRALCGLDVTQPNAGALQDEIKKNPERIRQAIEALTKAARMLRRDCNVPTPFWIPYSYQAVFLAYALRDPLPDGNLAILEKQLVEWFWRTSYTDFLRIGSRYQTQVMTMAALDGMRDGSVSNWRETDGIKVNVLPVRMSFRTARAKLLALRLASMQPKKFNSEPIDTKALLAFHQGNSFDFIVERFKLRGSNFNTPENRILYPPEQWASDRLLIDYMAGPDESVLRTHCLDARCIELLVDKKYDEFLERRRQILIATETQYLRVLGLDPIIE